MQPLASFLLAGALVLLLLSCGCTTPLPITPTPTQTLATTTMPTATPLSTPPPQATLFGVTWYLISMRSGASSNVLPGTEITAFFDGHGKVYGSSGCNQYTASYSGLLNNLAIGTPSTTDMKCLSPPGTMSQESLYLIILQGASRFKIEKNILTIMDSNGNTILTYSLSPPRELTPAPLIGSTWFLNSFVDAEGNFYTKGQSHPISLHLTNDNKLNGNAGCNDYSGSFAVSGSTISINAFATTARSCDESEVMELEKTYLAVLPQIMLYQISGNELTLSDGTGKISMIYDTMP
ncbi:MAG TPA: META domain-containing protein [Methanoregulaceae archaeon]|nr:MAG: META domain-containing protein [Methanolinea sp.]HON81261.1 META domain-containing protein [Methanoregulaceae archaeon]HPD10133.1 META domain-containing protein [Methanoregulaceae archaeon]HRT15139.1 META domain-containing protein [Methanoregulaceae archaeon]HRU30744.1 META domain-containing protein [Methanoregulaceae archaeon]